MTLGSPVSRRTWSKEQFIPLILVVGMFRAPSILRIVNDDHRSGSKNKVCPSQVPHRYCVVGAFHVTDIWGEKSDSCVIFKFRMQEVDLERKSDAQDSISILSNHQLGSPIGDRSLFFPLFSFFFFLFIYKNRSTGSDCDTDQSQRSGSGVDWCRSMARLSYLSCLPFGPMVSRNLGPSSRSMISNLQAA